MKSVLAIVLIVAAAESMHIPPEIEVTGSVYCDREGDPEPHMIKLELVQGVYDPPAKAIGYAIVCANDCNLFVLPLKPVPIYFERKAPHVVS